MLNFITQSRRGTTAEWDASSVIPRSGEIVLEECSDGLTKFKVGNGVSLFKELPYVNEDLATQIVAIQSRLDNIVNLADLEENLDVDPVGEVLDIRVGHDGTTYQSAGTAVRAVGKEVSDLSRSLSGFINGQAVDGLYYDTENSKLYLTAKGQKIPGSEVHIVSGSGGGGGGSSSDFKINYAAGTDDSYVTASSDPLYIEFIVTAKDAAGDPLTRVNASWKVDSKVVASQVVADGYNKFDISPFLSYKTHEVMLTITSPNGNDTAEKYWTVQKVDLRVTCDLDDTRKQDANKNLNVDYTVTGAIDKTLHILLDGEVVEEYFIGADTFDPDIIRAIPASLMKHGSHLLECYLTAMIDGEKYSSLSDFKDLAVVDETQQDANAVIVTNRQNISTKQYEVEDIIYSVYLPSGNPPTVHFYEDGTLIKTQTLDKGPTDVYPYDAAKPGNHVIQLRCGAITKTINVFVEEVDLPIEPLETGLAFDFRPVGKSNNDTNRLWKDSKTGVEMSVSEDFDWINGGYQTDRDQSTGAIIQGSQHFLIKAGTTATIKYPLFGDDAKQLGKNFKLIFKTTNVSDSTVPFINCVPNNNNAKIGLVMRPQDAVVYGQSGQLNLAYSEEEIIEFEFNISKITDSVPMIMGYEDGVSTRALPYDKTYNFQQSEPLEIEIGSTNCDVHVYRCKCYSTSLSHRQILTNFISDARTSDELLDRFKRNQIYTENHVLTPESVAKACPHLRVYKLEAPWFTTGKDKKFHVSGTTIQQIYKDGDKVLDNWTCYDCTHGGQGTTSDDYGAAGRNLDFIMNTDSSYFILGDGKTRTDKISLTRTSIPVNYLTLKVNIASSNNATNALLARVYNRNNPYKRPFAESQKVHTTDDSGNPVTLTPKDTMEFYNCVIFIRETDTTRDANGKYIKHNEFNDLDWHFYAIGNIGDSKKTDKTRATDRDDPYECCVEIMDVERPLSAFPVDTMIDANAPIIHPKTKEVIGTWLEDKHLGKLCEKDPLGNYYPTSDTTINKTKQYYIDILEYDDFSEVFTYGWRYCPGEDDSATLKVCHRAWVEFYRFITRSTDEEFKENFEFYMHKDSALFYYLFTLRYCMVDNRAKNTFWHFGKTGTFRKVPNPHEDLLPIYYEKRTVRDEQTGNLVVSYVPTNHDIIDEYTDYYCQHAFDLAWDYDNDTALGLNNYGSQVYRYGLEDMDVDENKEDVFREKGSIFFCRVRDLFSGELKTLYNDLDTKKLWDAKTFLSEFDTWQNQFPEELWRLDIERKYIRSFVTSFIEGPPDAQFLTNMCNGKMKYHTHQWETNQYMYMSTKYQTDYALNTVRFVRLRGAHKPETSRVDSDYSFTLTPNAYMYLNVRYGNANVPPYSYRVTTPGKEMKVPEEYLVPASADVMTIFTADQLSDIGDLSTKYAESASVGGATKLLKLKLGNQDPTYSNDGFSEFTSGANTLLQELDVRNVTGFKGSVDLSQLISLQTLLAKGTQITSVLFANGGRLNHVELPAVTSLRFTNLKHLVYNSTTKSHIDLASFNNVIDLVVEDCPSIDAVALLEACANVKRLRLTGLYWDLRDKSSAEITRFFETNYGAYRGIDAEDKDLAHAYLEGTVDATIIEGQDYTELKSKYSQLTFNYTRMPCTITFMPNEGNTPLYTSRIVKTDSSITYTCEDPVAQGWISTPQKPSTDSEVFTFAGWSYKNDGIPLIESPLNDIDGNLVLYPTFKATTRQYTVRFYNNDNSLLSSYKVDYGTERFEYPSESPQKAGVSTPSAYVFDGWIPEPKNIISDLDCYATYQMLDTAVYDVQLSDLAYTKDVSKKTLHITKYLNTTEKIIRIPSSFKIDQEDYRVDSIIGYKNDDPNVQGFREANLEYLSLPEGLTKLESQAFRNNPLLASVNIPSTLTMFGPAVFEGCSGLMDVYYNAVNASVVKQSNELHVFDKTASSAGYKVHVGKDVTIIPDNLFRQAILEETKYAAKVISFEEGSRCHKIGSSAFKLTRCTEVNLPESLKTISDQAFSNCCLTNINLPSQLTTIGSTAFDNSLTLKNVTIPVSVSSINSSAFRGCPNVDFQIDRGSRFLWVDNCFINTTTNTLLFVHEGFILPEKDKYTGVDIKIIDSYAFEALNTTSLVLIEGIQKLNQHAIYKCKNIESLTLPSTLTTIDSLALYELNVTELILPINLNTIGMLAFVDNLSLRELTIPQNVHALGNAVLRGNTSLTTVVIEPSTLTVTKPPDEMYWWFPGCSQLTNITVNWRSDSANMLPINTYAPWGAGTVSREVPKTSETITPPRVPVTVNYTDKTIVYNIDGTTTIKT